MSEYVYVMSNPSIRGAYKIGFTTQLPEQRAKDLRHTGVPTDYVVEHVCRVEYGAYDLEQMCHAKFAKYNIGKEWFHDGLELDVIQEFLDEYDLDALTIAERRVLIAAKWSKVDSAFSRRMVAIYG